MANAYDPSWYRMDKHKLGFETTSCEEAVSPSQFVGLKYHCPKGKQTSNLNIHWSKLGYHIGIPLFINQEILIRKWIHHAP